MINSQWVIIKIGLSWQLTNDSNIRQEKWTEAVCVGSKKFVEQLKHQLGVEVLGRTVKENCEAYVLREPAASYNTRFDAEKDLLSMDNGVCFDEGILE